MLNPGLVVNPLGAVTGFVNLVPPHCSTTLLPAGGAVAIVPLFVLPVVVGAYVTPVTFVEKLPGRVLAAGGAAYAAWIARRLSAESAVEASALLFNPAIAAEVQKLPDI